ncbi:MAG TPA: nuclear transport factor 2 family protein [Acidimicrobiia bacterium]
METRFTSGDRHSDVEQITGHVFRLFDAYLEGDRAALAAGRSEDWKGFQIRSTRLIRGVDSYLEELEAVLGSLRVERYEFLDFEVEVHHDLALVYYVARDWLADDEGTVLVRALDVYRRLGGSWTQVGSNICSVPDPGAAPTIS